ncbi:ras and Rab interactor 2-like [Heptranchias perlo]|uniref:ras and Rab interactor 2-like n=1 Tax=Heptranchias perlo TaxID=212740 RepID=UPI003559F318
MQEEPIYDAPEMPCAHQPTHKPSLTKVSVLDRLIFTHSVWLQLTMNSATSLHILQRENPGIFLVRKSGTSQKKVLSVRLLDDSDPSFVHDFTINEDTSNTTFSLEGSGVTFGDLFHLISFYCVSRDVLPFTLKLPQAIATARSHKRLKTISHLGIEFWNSALNVREQLEEGGSESPQETNSPGRGEAEESPLNRPWPLKTRPPRELCRHSQNGALCFVNPLFLEEHCKVKRSQFKRSFKVRVSTETSSPLSPPTEPPPPVPFGGPPESAPQPGTPMASSSSDDDTSYQQPRPPIPPPRLKKKQRSQAKGAGPALSPTAEEEYRVPTPVTLHSPGRGDPPESPLASLGEAEADRRLSNASSSSESEVEGLGLIYGGPLPPISELDAQSLSSEEEEEEEEEVGQATDDPRPPTPKTRRSHSVGWMVRARFQKVSRVFSSFGSPGKKMVQSIEARSRDQRTYLGGLVQDFLGALQEGRGPYTSSGELLQSLRQFMTHTKLLLLHSSELDPTFDIFIEEEEKDHWLEVAMHKCVLKPLKRYLNTCLRDFHTADGSLQQVRENLLLVRQAGPQSLGVRVSAPEIGTVEKIKQRFIIMQKTYSPIKKVNFLLQACKLIYERVNGREGEPFGADDFLPTMSYIIAQCDLPELSMEVEYMMELLGQSELMGEGGYYLTSLYASMYELQNYHVDQPATGISKEVQSSLKQWHKRRRTYGPLPSVNDFQNFLRVAYEDASNGCTAKTLVVKPAETAEELCRLCAQKFKVQEPEGHGLFLVVDDSCRQLPGDSHPQRIKAELKGQDGSGYYHFIYKPIEQEIPARGNRRLLRDDAVDHGEAQGPIS